MHLITRPLRILYTFILFRFTDAKINTPIKVSNVLQEVFENDQKLRTSRKIDISTMAEMKFLDKINLIKIEAIIKRHRWPFDDKLDNAESNIIFLTIQHSNLSKQQKYLSLIEAAVELGKLKSSCIAFIKDRIAIQTGMPQIFGTQIATDLETGISSPLLIGDHDSVDDRRKSVGLEPLLDYLQKFN